MKDARGRFRSEAVHPRSLKQLGSQARQALCHPDGVRAFTAFKNPPRLPPSVSHSSGHRLDDDNNNTNFLQENCCQPIRPQGSECDGECELSLHLMQILSNRKQNKNRFVAADERLNACVRACVRVHVGPCTHPLPCRAVKAFQTGLLWVVEAQPGEGEGVEDANTPERLLMHREPIRFHNNRLLAAV